MSQAGPEELGSDKEAEINGTTTGPREYDSDQRKENGAMGGGELVLKLELALFYINIE